MKLAKSFYTRNNVVEIAQDLLGKYLFSEMNGFICAGMIVETEAYCGAFDKACHAHFKRRTKRTETMYQEGGIAYVYLCYGVHSLFNVVTNEQDEADAVLIRAIEPTLGIDKMMERRKMQKKQYRLTAGPGVLSQALGITTKMDGISLLKNQIWIEDQNKQIPKEQIIAGPRIGIDYAEEDAMLPWRFTIKGNKWISKAR